MAKKIALPSGRSARLAALKKHLRSIQIGIGIGIVCGLAMILLGSTDTGFIGRTEMATLDYRYRTRPRIPVHPQVGLINYDDASLALFGSWPWPRHRQVALVTMMDFYDAGAAGYDVFFSEKNDIVVMDGRLRKFIADTSAAKLPPARVTQTLRTSIRDYDREFEKSIQSANNIYLGYFVQEPDRSIAKDGLPAIRQYVEEDKKTWTDDKRAAAAAAEQYTVPASPLLEKYIFKMSNVVQPLPGMTRASRGIGFAQIVQDIDHTVRLYPMFMYYDGRIYPSIGCIMLSSLLGVPFDSWVIKPGDEVEIPGALVPGETVPQTIRMPVNENGQMLMNWAAKFDDVFLHVPFWLVSEYYAYYRAKNIARLYPAEFSSYPELHREIVNSIDEEQMVTEEKSQRIAGEIALAHVATPLLKAGKSVDDVLKALKSAHIEVAQARDILSAVALAHESVLAQSQPALPARIDIDAEWKAEIERNVAWFSSKERLADVEPLFFSPPQRVLWAGERKSFSPLDLENKIFMIGLTGVGTIDLNPMPFENVSPMVGLHSNSLNTILVRKFLKFPKPWWRYPLDLGFSLVTALIGALTTPFIGFLAVAIMIGAYSYAVWWAFAVHGQWIYWVEPSMAALLTFTAVVVFHFIQAQREKAKVKGMFGAMVSPAVLKLMEDNPESFSLTGVRKPGTMMFSAVEKFGKVTTGVAPDELGGVLSHYLTPTSEIIMDYSGYIDKYEGHVIMADYGVPLDDPGHAWKCCFSAIEQQLDIHAFQFFVKARYGVDVFVAMGINSGYISAGNMGSEKKMQYTVMGDAVNMSARFRPANNIYDTRIIAGEPTYFVVKDYLEMRLLDKLIAKGKTKPTTIFEIQGWQPQAYMELKKNAPVPPSLLNRWSKCPAEKIFGYHRFWAQKEKDFSHPLIPKVREFFESELPAAEEIIKAEGRFEIQKFHTELETVRKDAAALLGKSFNGSTAAGKSWDTILDHWIASGRTIEEAIEEGRALAGQNEAVYAAFENAFSRASALANKLKTLKNRLAFHAETESVMERFLVDLHEAVEKMAGQDAAATAAAQAVIDSKRTAYRTAVESFYNRLCEKPIEYHEMLSVVGTTTETQKKARTLFVDGVNLHWERAWDASLAKFRAVLELIPADGPAKAYLERVEGYKTDPPGDNWQGEFVQKKK